MSGSLARPQQPAQEGPVVRLEARRHAAVAVGAVELDGRLAARVPRVAPAVAVAVVHVVGLPRVGREHDELPRCAEGRRPQDERREADPPVVGRQLRRVHAGRPAAGLHGDRGRGGALAGPVERHRIALGGARHLVVPLAARRLGAAVEELQGQRRRHRRGSSSSIGSPGAYERCRKAASTPSTRTTGACWRAIEAGRLPPSTVFVGAAGDRQPHHVRADRAWRRRASTSARAGRRRAAPSSSTRRSSPGARCAPPRASRSRRRLSPKPTTAVSRPGTPGETVAKSARSPA